MAVIVTLLNACLDRLTAAFTDLVVEFFPGLPATHVLTHEKGVLVLSCTRARFTVSLVLRPAWPMIRPRAYAVGISLAV